MNDSSVVKLPVGLAPLNALLKDARLCGLGLPSDEDIDRKLAATLTTDDIVEVLSLKLPKLCKAYDKGLSTGSLDWGLIDSSLEGIPAILDFRGLLALSFHQDGGCRIPHPNIVFFTRCILLHAKNIYLPCPEQAIADSVDKFVDTDLKLRPPSGTWTKDVWLKHRHRFTDDVSGDLRPLVEVLQAVSDRLTPSCEVDIYSLRPRHGPGAVADKTNEGDKYTFRYWPNKMAGTFSYEYFGAVSEEWVDTSVRTRSGIEPPARLLAVPKDMTKPRLITSEPTAHQFLQQGLLGWFRDNMKSAHRSSINFHDQTQNQRLCLQGSIDGNSATVDLSEASDRLSLWTIERVFGVNQSLLECLHACRTRVVINGTRAGRHFTLQLRKFAGMGSAMTFPLQSVVYCNVAIAAVLYDRGLRPTKRHIRRVGREIGVFGDDIILPSSSVPTLTRLLDYLQLVVN
jgi:hypothetical protein